MHETGTVRIGGLSVAAVTRRELAAMLAEDHRARRAGDLPPKVLTSANGNVLSLCARDPGLKAMIEASDLVDADGMSLVFGSRLLGGPSLPERVATTDFFHDAAAVAVREGLRFFLLGGTVEVNAAALDRVRALHPGLQVEGRHGYFGPEEEAGVIETVRHARPDVVWVGLGVPREQAFALKLKTALAKDRVTWIKTCGGLFDFLSGRNARAPGWVQDAGLEWAWRTMLEPRRLFMRYAVTNIHAIWLMAKHRHDLRAEGVASSGPR